LVLLGTDADAADPNSDDTKGLLDLANQVAAQGPAPAIDAMAPIMLAPDNHNPAMAAQVRGLMQPGNARGIEGALRGMAVRKGAKAWLGQVKVPTLVAMGDADQVIPPAASRAIAAAIPNAKLATLKGAGHLLPLERTAELNALLTSWLR
jgi:pimeloyl-ACP methyl ester carboxylesterase